MRLPTGRMYKAPIWDPSASEVFVTNASLDWGSERLLFEAMLPGVFVDVGAHTGYYSAYIAPKATRVIAIEPNARCLPVLRENLRGVDARIVQGFAAEEAGEANIRTTPQGYAYADVHGSDVIRMVTVDDLASGEKVTAIKIDVDGPDLLVLDGATATIRRDRPIVLIEAPSDHALHSRVSAFGYDVWGYTRSEGTKFTRLEAGATAHTKMAFLLPEERVAEVRQRAQSSS